MEIFKPLQSQQSHEVNNPLFSFKDEEKNIVHKIGNLKSSELDFLKRRELALKVFTVAGLTFFALLGIHCFLNSNRYQTLSSLFVKKANDLKDIKPQDPICVPQTQIPQPITPVPSPLEQLNSPPEFVMVDTREAMEGIRQMQREIDALIVDWKKLRSK